MIQLRDVSGEILKLLRPWDPIPADREMVGFDEIARTRERINARFGQYAVDSLLDRFTCQGGIEGATNFEAHPVERWLLLDSRSPFRLNDCRTRLQLLTADPDEIVSRNCLVYLDMLTQSEDRFRPKTLAADKDLVVPLWTAASRIRPQETKRGRVIEMIEPVEGGSERFQLDTNSELDDSRGDLSPRATIELTG